MRAARKRRNLDRPQSRPRRGPARYSGHRRTAPPLFLVTIGKPGRARKARQPFQPLGASWHVLALVLVGAGHEIGVDARPPPSAAQRLDALASGAAVCRNFEALEHAVSLGVAPRTGNSQARSINRGLGNSRVVDLRRLRNRSVVQPAMRRCSTSANSWAHVSRDHRRRLGIEQPAEDQRCRRRAMDVRTSGASAAQRPGEDIGDRPGRTARRGAARDGRARGRRQTQCAAQRRWPWRSRQRPQRPSDRCRSPRRSPGACARAAAIASTPDPQPRSSTRRNVVARVRPSMISRQPCVVA